MFLMTTRTGSYIDEFDATGSFMIGTGRSTDIPYNRVSGDHCVWECEEPYGGGGKLVCVDGEFVAEGKCEVRTHRDVVPRRSQGRGRSECLEKAA